MNNEWQDIESAFESLQYNRIGGGETRYFEDALIYGPTWESSHYLSDYPKDGGGGWTGEPVIAIASTYDGAGFWTKSSDGPSDYDLFIQPTHWMPLPEPPCPTTSSSD